jgi:hypothetical protein
MRTIPIAANVIISFYHLRRHPLHRASVSQSGLGVSTFRLTKLLNTLITFTLAMSTRKLLLYTLFCVSFELLLIALEAEQVCTGRR